MRSKLYKYSLIGFVFVSIFGSLGHFFFKWSGYNKIIGLFFSVNESAWEHLKLILIPYFIWSIIEYFLLNRDKCIFFCKAVGVVCGMISTLAFFYTYTGITGKNIDALNIFSFFFGVFIAFAVDYVLIKQGLFCGTHYSVLGTFIIFLIIVVFMLFTFVPPLIPLFKDPISQGYGI